MTAADIATIEAELARAYGLNEDLHRFVMEAGVLRIPNIHRSGPLRGLAERVALSAQRAVGAIAADIHHAAVWSPEAKR